MKYCVRYPIRYFKYYNSVDEILIHYNKSDLTLPEFVEKYAGTTIIIDMEKCEDDDLKLLSPLSKKYGNIKLRIPFVTEILERVKNAGVPFFFSVFVNNWPTLAGLAEYEPTDMYITDELGFEIKDVSAFLHERNIAVRVFPSVAQSMFHKTPDEKKFFIRPEDISIYEDYVDVCEFFPQKSKVYYEIYAIDKEWDGNLNESIEGFGGDYKESGIIPGFAKTRLNCGQHCRKGKSCNICERLLDISNLLVNNNYRIKNN